VGLANQTLDAPVEDLGSPSRYYNLLRSEVARQRVMLEDAVMTESIEKLRYRRGVIDGLRKAMDLLQPKGPN